MNVRRLFTIGALRVNFAVGDFGDAIICYDCFVIAFNGRVNTFDIGVARFRNVYAVWTVVC